MTMIGLDGLQRITKTTNDKVEGTSAQLAASAEHQVYQAALGNLDSVACPYCGSNVRVGIDGICCKPMDDAATTVLDHLESTEFDAKAAEAGSAARAADAFAHPNKINSVQ
jgi:hypothetical protein